MKTKIRNLKKALSGPEIPFNLAEIFLVLFSALAVIVATKGG